MTAEAVGPRASLPAPRAGPALGDRRRHSCGSVHCGAQIWTDDPSTTRLVHVVGQAVASRQSRIRAGVATVAGAAASTNAHDSRYSKLLRRRPNGRRRFDRSVNQDKVHRPPSPTLCVRRRHRGRLTPRHAAEASKAQSRPGPPAAVASSLLASSRPVVLHSVSHYAFGCCSISSLCHCPSVPCHCRRR